MRYEDGSPRYFISQIQDVTAEKEAREELYHKRSELEIANAKLKQLATLDTLTQVLNRHARGTSRRGNTEGEPLVHAIVVVTDRRYTDVPGSYTV